MSQVDLQNRPISPGSSTDNRDDHEVEEDNKLADRLSVVIEDANERVVPLTKMIRKVSTLEPLVSSELSSEPHFVAYREHAS